MKYIDADQIRTEIERRMKEYDAIIANQATSMRAERSAWKWAECKSLLSFLDTLPEQPVGYNRAMLEVKAKIDELYDETSIGLNEYDAGLYNGIAETCMKLRGFIKARISSQEQPAITSKTRNERD